MKTILIISGVIALLATSGCVVADDGHRHHDRDHDRDHGHAEVIVAPPVVVVHPPEVIVR
jgi:hypothetical protein